ncbi:MAG: DUF2911 domain-containing protein [candidate division Zixibacteria bacterium]|nr:DUF2911 domain-containing protein [candidate division Zixibacteria bacterium]
MRRSLQWFGVAALAFAVVTAGPSFAQKSMPAGQAAKPMQDGNRGMLEIKLKGKGVSLNYGRPDMKGRDMLGMAPDGFVWRFGMNESTTFKTDSDLMFGDKKLAKGSYSAWIKHIKGEQWTLVFNKEVGVWGMPGAKRENDVLEVPLTYSKKGGNLEKLTVEFMEMGGGGHMVVNWGMHRLEVMFKGM